MDQQVDSFRSALQRAPQQPAHQVEALGLLGEVAGREARPLARSGERLDQRLVRVRPGVEQAAELPPQLQLDAAACLGDRIEKAERHRPGAAQARGRIAGLGIRKPADQGREVHAGADQPPAHGRQGGQPLEAGRKAQHLALERVERHQPPDRLDPAVQSRLVSGAVDRPDQPGQAVPVDRQILAAAGPQPFALVACPIEQRLRKVAGAAVSVAEQREDALRQKLLAHDQSIGSGRARGAAGAVLMLKFEDQSAAGSEPGRALLALWRNPDGGGMKSRYCSA